MLILKKGHHLIQTIFLNKYKLKRDTLLISIGPAQLLTQLTIIKEFSLTDRLIGAVRMQSIYEAQELNPKMLDAEKWMLAAQGIDFLGIINRPYQIWGQSKLEKFKNIFFFTKAFKKYFKLNIPTLNMDDVRTLIFTYRPEVGDAFILKAFDQINKVYLNADGNISFFVKELDFKVQFPLAFIGVKNFYASKPNVYFPNHLLPEEPKNVKPEILSAEAYDELINELTSTDDYQDWFHANFSSKDENVGILFLSPLCFDWGISNILDLYENIIGQEFGNSLHKLIIKFHPRETSFGMKEYRDRFEKKYKNKLVFLSSEKFSFMPIEVSFSKVNVKRVITLLSTAVYQYKNDDNVQIKLYTQKDFYQKLIKNAHDIGRFLNVNVNYVDGDY